MDLLEAAEALIDGADDRVSERSWVFVRRDDWNAFKAVVAAERGYVERLADAVGGFVQASNPVAVLVGIGR